MTQLLGPITQLNHALPSGVDATRLAQWRLKSGESYVAFRNRVATALTQLNISLLNGWGDLFRITEQDYLEYRNGGTLTDMQDITDLDRPELRKYTTIAHSLDLRAKGDGIGGADRFWRDARAAYLEEQIMGIVDTGQQTFEKSLLTRAMTNTVNTLGTSGYDMPFANASGTLAYTPPTWGGKVFASTHDHYVGYNTASLGFDDMINGLAIHVAEHGHAGNLCALVSEADIASYAVLGDRFVQPTANRVQFVDRGGQSSGVSSLLSLRDFGGRPAVGPFFIGDFISDAGIVELKAIARIPTGYAFVFNRYGQNMMKNALAVRVHPDVGFGFYIKEIPDENTDYPIKVINIEIEYGISTNSGRLNGAAGYLVSGGAWVNPTIT